MSFPRTAALLVLLLALALPALSRAQEPEADRVPGSAFASPGWRVETGYASQAIFDPGVHLFSSSSWLPGVELRATRTTIGAGPVAISPEAALAFFAAGRRVATQGSTTLLLPRATAGARASLPLADGRVVPFVRGGAAVVAGSARFHDPWRTRERDAIGAGAFASAGVLLDAGRFGVRSRLTFSVEAGHTLTTPLGYGSWGRLDVDASSIAATAGLSF